MKVALIGLGDIAQKAYLPLLGALRDVQPVLVTRDAARLAELGDRYRVRERHRSVAEALGTGLDAAFVHTATTAHAEVVTALLEHGVPTYVDKPLADSYASAAALVALADREQVPLAVGFNRRYAPAYREVALWPDLDVVVMHKHRAGSADAVRRVVFDDFIHVLDTLRFVLDGAGTAAGPPELAVTARVDTQGLHRVAVQLTADQRVAAGVMHRTTGITEEVLEVVAPGRRRRVVDLAEVADAEGGAERRVRRDQWVPVSVQRGFAQICGTFLDAVRDGRPVSAHDALETHALCERVVEAVERLRIAAEADR